jgi:hypothetical protein
METKEIEHLWNNHKNTVYRLSHNFWNSYPKIDWEEYYEGGLDCFIRCIERYAKEQNNGACFNTYLHVSVTGFFKGMVAKHITMSQLMEVEHPKNNQLEEWQTVFNSTEIRYPNSHIDSVVKHDGTIPERQVILRDLLSKMSDDAIEAVNCVFRIGAKTRSEIRTYLLNIWHGEDVQNRITNTFDEIKNTLRMIAI